MGNWELGIHVEILTDFSLLKSRNNRTNTASTSSIKQIQRICTIIPNSQFHIDSRAPHGPRMNDKTDWNRTCFNHMYRLCRCMWIPTKKSLAISTGNRYLPVRKFVSSGANFRVPSCLAQNPQILCDRLTHSCVSRDIGYDEG